MATGFDSRAAPFLAQESLQRTGVIARPWLGPLMTRWWVSADSRGVPEQALKTLSGAYRRLAESAEVADRVFALAYLAELAVRLEDPARARDYLASLDELEVAPHSVGLAQTLAEAAELRAALEGPQA